MIRHSNKAEKKQLCDTSTIIHNAAPAGGTLQQQKGLLFGPACPSFSSVLWAQETVHDFYLAVT